MTDCIFVDTPDICTACSVEDHIQCLINHRHLKLSETGKEQLRHELEAEIITSRRYKNKSGESERPHPNLEAGEK